MLNQTWMDCNWTLWQKAFSTPAKKDTLAGLSWTIDTEKKKMSRYPCGSMMIRKVSSGQFMNGNTEEHFQWNAIEFAMRCALAGSHPSLSSPQALILLFSHTLVIYVPIFPLDYELLKKRNCLSFCHHVSVWVQYLDLVGALAILIGCVWWLLTRSSQVLLSQTIK